MNIAIERIKEIIDINQKKNDDFTNFALQGGAGSGKTESLKDIISYVSEKYPNSKIACITHTNVAVEEIIARVGKRFHISTIHSFLNSLIKNYKKNIREVMPEIFCLENVIEENHPDYKKAYERFSGKLFYIKKEEIPKVIGKREYDKSPARYNDDLNKKIKELNREIIQIISDKDYYGIAYNETNFDSFSDLTFSHNSLLTLSFKLSEKYDLLPKIISDKYDFIFIDEYQDTNKKIIELFLKLLPQNKKTTIGLFGDSMQGIYDDGIGDIRVQIEKGELTKIAKEDNYRCSKEVIDFINIIRTDEIEQKLALKENEAVNDRIGKVVLYYSIYGKKPTAFNKQEEKDAYLTALNNLINSVKNDFNYSDRKILMLTNKSVSTEVGFLNLYKVFSERFLEVKEEIEKELSKLQVTDICELLKLYGAKNYNSLINYLKKNGFQIKSVEDKKRIHDEFTYLATTDLSLKEVLDYVFERKIISRSERNKNYLSRKEKFLEEFDKNFRYQELETYYKKGSNTIVRLKTNENIDISEEEFKDFESALKKKTFYINLLSDKIKFKEVINYYNYLNEEAEYLTMHKTKGSGIENVFVVLDEYLWSKYNFKTIYDLEVDPETRYKNQKLFYVACSRAKRNLAIARLIEDQDEEKMMKEYFKQCEIVKK